MLLAKTQGVRRTTYPDSSQAWIQVSDRAGEESMVMASRTARQPGIPDSDRLPNAPTSSFLISPSGSSTPAKQLAAHRHDPSHVHIIRHAGCA